MSMKLPFDRQRLRDRNRIEEEDAAEEAAIRSPAEGLRHAIEVSDLVRTLAAATGAPEVPVSLEEEARVYVRPLRLMDAGLERAAPT